MNCVKDYKYIFIGNRFSVLERLFHNGCAILKIFAVNDSFLSKELDKREIEYYVLPTKKELISILLEEEYDVLVSNGCPYILPISLLNNGKRKFVNVHPSLLPDLKGKNPINGAILFNRKHGVTCHYMDDGIDTGAIIEQIEIPISEDISLDLLYKISFSMEGEVFDRALHKNFAYNSYSLKENIEPIYYSRKNEDYYITESDNYEMICRRIKAFNSEGQYARILYKKQEIRLTQSKRIDNELLRLIYKKYQKNTVVDKYGREYFLFKTDKSFIQFSTLDLDKIEIGAKLMIRG